MIVWFEYEEREKARLLRKQHVVQEMSSSTLTMKIEKHSRIWNDNEFIFCLFVFSFHLIKS